MAKHSSVIVQTYEEEEILFLIPDNIAPITTNGNHIVNGPKKTAILESERCDFTVVMSTSPGMPSSKMIL